jgi:hypothetical protein
VAIQGRRPDAGAAVQFLELDGLMVPAARRECLNLVLFPERFAADALCVVESMDISWPAWREGRR